MLLAVVVLVVLSSHSTIFSNIVLLPVPSLSGGHPHQQVPMFSTSFWLGFLNRLGQTKMLPITHSHLYQMLPLRVVLVVVVRH